jgi:hypothetical protein
MRKTLLVMALVGLLASPVLADFGDIGLGVPPGNVFVYPSGPSATYTTTWYFHINASLFPAGVDADFLHYQFVWDLDEVTIMNIAGAGMFAGMVNNASQLVPFVTSYLGYTTGTHGAQSGTFGGTALSGTPTFPGQPNSFHLSPSVYYPFLQVQYHVDNPIYDFYYDIRLDWIDIYGGFTSWTSIVTYHSNASLWSSYVSAVVTNYTWTLYTTDIRTGNLLVMPEPASAGLLACGLIAVAGGIWRRRR